MSFAAKSRANLKQITLRSQGQRQFGAHALTLGIDLRQRKIQYDSNSRLDTCTDFNPDCENVDAALTKAAAKRSLNRYAAYLDDRWTIGKFALSAGLRFTNAYNNDNFRSIEYQPLALGSAEFRLVGEQALEFFPLIGVKVSF